MNMPMQLDLIGFTPEEERLKQEIGSRIRRAIQRLTSGNLKKSDIPLQFKMKWGRISKTGRKRMREIKGVGNDFNWPIEAIYRLHLELFRDWKERLNTKASPSVKYDLWLWMLDDSGQPFSFRDCLLAVDYTHPEIVLEGVFHNRPQWYRQLEDKSDAEVVAILTELDRQHLGLKSQTALAA